jgi:hypothetical protein
VRKLLCSLLLAMGLVCAVVLTHAGRSAARNGHAASAPNGVVRPAIPGQPAPLAGRTFKSANWSGYVTTSKAHHITAVTSTFLSPSPTLHPGYSSTWAGIGGFKTHDLIQAGTSEFVNTTGPTYFAWFEMLPGPEKQLHNCTGDPLCTVTAHDNITVAINRLPSGRWHFSVADSTNGWSWTKTVSYNSTRSSAEWILEAPTVNGAQSTLPRGLGTSVFGPTSTYVVNGVTRTIAQGNPVTVDMVTAKGRAEATPSALASNSQSFDVCAYKSSCPPPP